MKKNEKNLHQWKTRAADFSNNQSKNSDQVVSILFLEEPSQEIKQKLKKINFIGTDLEKNIMAKGKNR